MDVKSPKKKRIRKNRPLLQLTLPVSNCLLKAEWFIKSELKHTQTQYEYKCSSRYITKIFFINGDCSCL